MVQINQFEERVDGMSTASQEQLINGLNEKLSTCVDTWRSSIEASIADFKRVTGEDLFEQHRFKSSPSLVESIVDDLCESMSDYDFERVIDTELCTDSYNNEVTITLEKSVDDMAKVDLVQMIVERALTMIGEQNNG